ncbi:hypothetical protein [Schumannella soli]|uniref:Uncharacterized protein n=1 Tax=Schumannella soli TaxID=2590779 RepID=A0A506Y123_9MICO|nr:hypothetical protein [Schumannella soli]TPW75705.1 hypothetical protein FJ657_07455 [Schumannella soli]
MPRFAEHTPGPARLLALVVRDVALAVVYAGLVGLGAVLLTALLVEELQPFGPLQADADRIVRGALAFVSLGFLAAVVVRFVVATPIERLLLARQELRRRQDQPDLVAPLRDRTALTDDSLLGGIRGLVAVVGGVGAVLTFCAIVAFLIDPDDDPEFLGSILLILLGVTAFCFVMLNTFRRSGPFWWWRLRRTVGELWTPEFLATASRAERAARAGFRGERIDLNSARHRRWGRAIAIVQSVAGIAFALSGITLVIAAKSRQPCRGCAPRVFGAAGESAIDVLAMAVIVFALVALAALALAMVGWMLRRLLRRVELARAARVPDSGASPDDLAEELNRVSVSVLFGMGVVTIASVVAAYLATAMLVAGDSDIPGAEQLVGPLGSALAGVGAIAAAAIIAIAAGHLSGVRHRNRLRARWTPGDPPAPDTRRVRRTRRPARRARGNDDPRPNPYLA